MSSEREQDGDNGEKARGPYRGCKGCGAPVCCTKHCPGIKEWTDQEIRDCVNCNG